MLRQKLMGKTGPSKTSFRIRGTEVQRIEGFSDGVFAFTVTLLVVSLEVPKTFSELLDTMHDFFAFAVGFAILVSVWFSQYVWFRRFGLRDSLSIFLNAALLFMVLFYAFPLKFLWKFLFDQFLNYKIDSSTPPAVTKTEAPWMMVIYGVGFIAINLMLAALYFHAYRQRDELELSRVERFDTISVICTHLINMAVGLISSLIALAGGEGAIAISGFSYFLVPVAIAIFRAWRGRQKRQHEALAEG